MLNTMKCLLLAVHLLVSTGCTGAISRQKRLVQTNGKVDFSSCVVEPDGRCCTTSSSQVEGLTPRHELECRHKTVEVCHYTYITIFTPTREEQCQETFSKKCYISFRKEVETQLVQHCRTPVEKECVGKGPEECKTVTETFCSTKYREKSPGKFVGDTSCEKIPQLICGAGCTYKELPKECHDKYVDSENDVPEESCELFPQKTCQQVTKLSPALKPKHVCTEEPAQVCHLKFKSVRTNVTQGNRWCLLKDDPLVDRDKKLEKLQLAPPFVPAKSVNRVGGVPERPVQGPPTVPVELTTANTRFPALLQDISPKIQKSNQFLSAPFIPHKQRNPKLLKTNTGKNSLDTNTITNRINVNSPVVTTQGAESHSAEDKMGNSGLIVDQFIDSGENFQSDPLSKFLTAGTLPPLLPPQAVSVTVQPPRLTKATPWDSATTSRPYQDFRTFNPLESSVPRVPEHSTTSRPVKLRASLERSSFPPANFQTFDPPQSEKFEQKFSVLEETDLQPPASTHLRNSGVNAINLSDKTFDAENFANSRERGQEFHRPEEDGSTRIPNWENNTNRKPTGGHGNKIRNQPRFGKRISPITNSQQKPQTTQSPLELTTKRFKNSRLKASGEEIDEDEKEEDVETFENIGETETKDKEKLQVDFRQKEQWIPVQILQVPLEEVFRTSPPASAKLVQPVEVIQPPVLDKFSNFEDNYEDFGADVFDAGKTLGESEKLVAAPEFVFTTEPISDMLSVKQGEKLPTSSSFQGNQHGKKNSRKNLKNKSILTTTPTPSTTTQFVQQTERIIVESTTSSRLAIPVTPWPTTQNTLSTDQVLSARFRQPPTPRMGKSKANFILPDFSSEVLKDMPKSVKLDKMGVAEPLPAVIDLPTGNKISPADIGGQRGGEKTGYLPTQNTLNHKEVKTKKPVKSGYLPLDPRLGQLTKEDKTAILAEAKANGYLPFDPREGKSSGGPDRTTTANQLNVRLKSYKNIDGFLIPPANNNKFLPHPRPSKNNNNDLSNSLQRQTANKDGGTAEDGGGELPILIDLPTVSHFMEKGGAANGGGGGEEERRGRVVTSQPFYSLSLDESELPSYVRPPPLNLAALSDLLDQSYETSAEAGNLY